MPPTLQDARQELEKRAKEMQAVSAERLAAPTEPVKLPEPMVAEPNDRMDIVDQVRNQVSFDVDQFRADQQKQREQLEQLQALGEEGSISDFRQEELERMEVPQNIRTLTDIQQQLADRKTESLGRQSDIARIGGITTANAGRAISAERARENVRSYGLAAQAAVLQGNIQTATTLVNQAVQTAYQDRQLRNQNLINQINTLKGIVDPQRAEILQKEQRMYEEDQNAIIRAQTLVDAAVSNGYVTPKDIEGLLAIKDPVVQANTAQYKISQGIKAKMDAAAAAAAGSGFDAPELKNFGTSDNPIWKQWNSAVGTWEDVTGLSASTVEIENAKQTKNQIDFLLDTTARILGDDKKGYNSLYTAASPNPTAEWVRRNVGSSSTPYTQLRAYAETLRVNVLTLMSDPDIRKFFGPQMTEKDAQFMMSAGSTLNVDTQTPKQIKQEVERMEIILSQMGTQASSLITPTPAPVQLAPNETFVQSPVGPVIIVD